MKTESLHFVGPWVGYCAALWALIFAVLHVIWAAGWYIGLREEQAREAFQQTWFMAYDLVVAGMCALAVVVALALVQSWGRRVPRRLLNVLAWCGTGLLVLRAGGSLAEMAYLLAAGKYKPDPMQLYEVWFWLGAVLFALSLWHFRHGYTTPDDAV